MTHAISKKPYDEFLYNVSGRLRKPIHTILETCTELLEAESENPKVQAIQTEGYQLLDLVNDIRDYAESQTGRMVLETGPIDLNAVVARVIEFAGWMVKSKPDVAFQKGRVDDLPAAQVQEARIQQVLLNLIHNALKFTDRGTLRLSAIRDGGEVTFEVADTGIGIPADRAACVFTPFETALPALDEERVGLGLGLPISKSIVESYGGRLWFESEEGKGSKFSFSLPVA
ncbi:MAG TPA: HAMP domain-containing sensor histidine kinase [Anaerolineae bacterium]|nr:HAMP domain-containing sensor histidine kinase [Anaerolineae bacterium]